MIRTQVYIPEDLHRQAKLIAKMEHTNFSTLVRQGLTHIIERKPRKSKKRFGKNFFGVLTYGPKNLSSRINDIYK